MKKIIVAAFLVVLGAFLFVYAATPKFKHKDTFVQQEFQNVYSRIGRATVIRSGVTPSPDTEGAIFLDTDAGANGTLVMYSNGAWRTVQAF